MSVNWQWLDELTEEQVKEKPLPLKNMLADSVYYPASGIDWNPVLCLNKLSRSFIYVDYNLSELDIVKGLINNKFKGYSLFALRLLTDDDIIQQKKLLCVEAEPEDGDPDWPEKQGWVNTTPFAFWSIWERNESFTDEDGPKRFSLLNLCAEGAHSYGYLYHRTNTCPLAICIIRPGTGFGLNWTDFREPRKILHRMAMHNDSGMPKYMLTDDQFDTKKAYWPEYPFLVEEFGSSGLFLFEVDPTETYC